MLLNADSRGEWAAEVSLWIPCAQHGRHLDLAETQKELTQIHLKVYEKRSYHKVKMDRLQQQIKTTSDLFLFHNNNNTHYIFTIKINH